MPVLHGEFAGRTEYQLRQAGADQHVAARRLAGGMCPALRTYLKVVTADI